MKNTRAAKKLVVENGYTVKECSATVFRAENAETGDVILIKPALSPVSGKEYPAQQRGSKRGASQISRQVFDLLTGVASMK